MKDSVFLFDFLYQSIDSFLVFLQHLVGILATHLLLEKGAKFGRKTSSTTRCISPVEDLVSVFKMVLFFEKWVLLEHVVRSCSSPKVGPKISLLNSSPKGSAVLFCHCTGSLLKTFFDVHQRVWMCLIFRRVQYYYDRI